MTREFDKSVEEALDDLKSDAYEQKDRKENTLSQGQTSDERSDSRPNSCFLTVYDVVPSDPGVDPEFLSDSINSVLSDNYVVQSVASGQLISERMDGREGFIVKIDYIGTESDQLDSTELKNASGVSDVNLHFDCDCFYCADS